MLCALTFLLSKENSFERNTKERFNKKLQTNIFDGMKLIYLFEKQQHKKLG
jgi:hypothetical protein